MVRAPLWLFDVDVHCRALSFGGKTPLLRRCVSTRSANSGRHVRLIFFSSSASSAWIARSSCAIRATAETLSGLVNLICEKMIMEPRHLQAVYTKLREGARNAEERKAVRDRRLQAPCIPLLELRQKVAHGHCEGLWCRSSPSDPSRDALKASRQRPQNSSQRGTFAINARRRCASRCHWSRLSITR